MNLSRIQLLGKILLALVIANPAIGAAKNQRLEKDSDLTASIEKAMNRVYPALVRIHVVTMRPYAGRMQKFQAAGSGAIISEGGYVITNHHVAGKGIRFVCRMPDGEEIEAELVGTDPLADIAILKLRLDNRPDDASPLPVAVFGDSDDVEVGDTVYAMGSPAALSQSVTRGIVSNTALIMSEFIGSMRLDGETVGQLVRWIAHDAKIYGGNSGGPLVNEAGEIIGINEIGVAGLSGAIPANLAQSVAKQLIEKGKVDRSWMGIDAQPMLKEEKDLEGVLVGGVIKDSPGDQAGVLPGDIILQYDGVPVKGRIPEDLPKFNALVMSTPIGEDVEIVLMRNGDKKILQASSAPRSRAQGEDYEMKSWGMTARDLTRLSALEKKRPDTDGVLVVTMRPGGPVQEAKPKLKQDDVIVKVAGEKVKDVATLKAISEKAIGESEERVPVLVEIERGTENLLTVVEIGRQPEDERPALARKAWLPIVSQVLTRDLAEKLGLGDQGGVRITQLYPGHSAEKAGLQRGDILLAVDDMPIEAREPEDRDVLYHMIRQYKIGSKVKLDVVRDGNEKQIEVVLEEPAPPTHQLDSYEDEYFEITVREISLEDRLLKQIDPDVDGVLVSQVKRASWAALAGLKSGDILLAIDGKPTEEVETVESILKTAHEKETERLVFFVRRGIHTMFLELEPSWDAETPKTEGDKNEE